MADKEPRSVLNFEIPSELLDQIKAEADRLQISVAGFMRMLAVHYLEKRQPPAAEQANQVKLKEGA